MSIALVPCRSASPRSSPPGCRASSSGQIHNPHGGGNTYALERGIDEDMLLTSVGWANSYYQEAQEYTDEWGIDWRSQEYQTRFCTGRYTEIACNPLSEAEAIATYTPPDPTRAELYSEAERMIASFKDEYWIGDDMGGQKAMLISPEMWRRFFKPRIARFVSELKAINPDVKIAYHSDGNINPIIADLIDVGIDVLNPVQPGCLDPAGIKKQFGDRLCLWGTIDEQRTLPFATPQEVREEVLLRLRTAGRGGGLILGPTHHLQLDTPMENFWAMVDTIRQTRYSELS